MRNFNFSKINPANTTKFLTKTRRPRQQGAEAINFPLPKEKMSLNHSRKLDPHTALTIKKFKLYSREERDNFHESSSNFGNSAAKTTKKLVIRVGGGGFYGQELSNMLVE